MAFHTGIVDKTREQSGPDNENRIKKKKKKKIVYI
jgi:hypothetical protein